MSRKYLLNIQPVIHLTRRLKSAGSINNEQLQAKPFSQIPGPSIYKLVTENFPRGKYFKKSLVEVNRLFNEEYGDICRIPSILGDLERILVFNADDFPKIIRNEGVWPVRSVFRTLQHYRDKRRADGDPEHESLLTSNGETWHRIRSAVNPMIMQPKALQLYTQQMDEISKEFVDLMRSIRDERSEMPTDFFSHVSTWALESLATIIIERRLGLLKGTYEDEHARTLIEYVGRFLEQSVDFEAGVSVWRYYETKAFKELMNTYEVVTRIIEHFIDEALERIESEPHAMHMEESVLRKLLKIDKHIASVVVNDLLITGVDTTSASFVSVMYLLAVNPEKQEKLRDEVVKVLPEKSDQLTTQKLKNFPYLRAVIKETLRCMPTTVGTIRQLQNDTVLAGYHVPKNTHVGMITTQAISNPRFYPEAEKFIPERWLKEACPHAVESNKFSYLPFGHGSRSCVGRRIANLEMEVGIANIVRNFRLEWHYGKMKTRNGVVNLPDSELKFRVTDV